MNPRFRQNIPLFFRLGVTSAAARECRHVFVRMEPGPCPTSPWNRFGAGAGLVFGLHEGSKDGDDSIFSFKIDPFFDTLVIPSQPSIVPHLISWALGAFELAGLAKDTLWSRRRRCLRTA